jgi:3D (Asp-Asp-Asp) domain-containing protein
MKKIILKLSVIAILSLILITAAKAFAYGNNPNFDSKAMAKEIIERVRDRENACERAEEKISIKEAARKLARSKPSKKTERAYRKALSDYQKSNQWLKDTYEGDYDYMCILNKQIPTAIVVHHSSMDYHKFPEQSAIISRAHKRANNAESCLSTKENPIHTAYHFTVGASGHVKQNRCIFERSWHTSNTETRLDSIGIVLGGNFEHNELTRPMVRSLNDLISMLQKEFNIKNIEGHCHNKATACPGKNARIYLTKKYNIPSCEGYEHDDHDDHHHGSAELPPKLVGYQQETDPLPDTTNPETIKATRWYADYPVISKLASFDMRLTRYYTVLPGQSKYFRAGGFHDDFNMNCQGDCFVTANGDRLDDSMAGFSFACPPAFPHGTELYLENWGIGVCRDRGSAIQRDKLDVWAGVGETGLNRIYNNDVPTGLWRVTIVSIPE